MSTDNVLVVFVSTMAKLLGELLAIVPALRLGSVITPACDTANPVNVTSLQLNVGVNGLVAVVVQAIVLPEFKNVLGAVRFTVNVLLVLVLTIAKLDGLVDTIVPTELLGAVTTPAWLTAKPDSVVLVHSKVSLNCVAVVVQVIVLPVL